MISQVNAETLAWEKCQLKLATSYCRRDGKKLGLFENLRVSQVILGEAKKVSQPLMSKHEMMPLMVFLTSTC